MSTTTTEATTAATGSRYRGRPDAIRALVEPDRVHRDLYIDAEIFALEQEHFFANTWSYVCHASQLKNAGDYVTLEIAGRPLVAVRHDDGSVRVLMNRCAHKGARVVSAPAGNTGKFFRCPYHAWAYNTDGSLRAIPLKSGYDGTRLADCEASRGLVPVRHVESYRGFVFCKLSDAGPGFASYFGDSLSSIDNLADRSPEGELEITGGCLRFLHACNWKMFVENLNDTMQPMAIEQFVPFVSDYKFFDDMGVRVFANGHSYSGVHFSIHSGYSGVEGYEEAMHAAYGAERSAEIMKVARHNTVYYPSLTIKGAIQSIRVVRPIAVDKTVIESWTFRLKGAPDALLARTVTYNRLINSPFSVVGHDDLHAYRAIQRGLQASGNPWVSLLRDFDPAEVGQAEVTAAGT